MDFKLPNHNEHQSKLLEDIQLSQQNILAQFSALNKRISNLELAHKNSPSDDQSKNILDSVDLNIFITAIASILLFVILLVFGWHFWDVPSQTQAVNDYIYSQIVKESPYTTSP